VDGGGGWAPASPERGNGGGLACIWGPGALLRATLLKVLHGIHHGMCFASPETMEPRTAPPGSEGGPPPQPAFLAIESKVEQRRDKPMAPHWTTVEGEHEGRMQESEVQDEREGRIAAS